MFKSFLSFFISWFEDCLHVEGARLLFLFYAETSVTWKNMCWPEL